MQKNNLKILIVRLYPLILMSSVFLFILFFILGFIFDGAVSDVLFALSFLCLIAYIPTFILISKLQQKDWYKKYERCFNLKRAKRENKYKLQQKAKELLKEYNIEDK